LRHVEVGRLTGRGRPFPADPDASDELLDRLVWCRTLDVAWLAPLSPDRFQLGRDKMRLELARHGRIPPSYWEGRDVNEMRRYHHVLVESVNSERGATPVEEDG
jgi:hypothetical protein